MTVDLVWGFEICLIFNKKIHGEFQNKTLM